MQESPEISFSPGEQEKGVYKQQSLQSNCLRLQAKSNGKNPLDQLKNDHWRECQILRLPANLLTDLSLSSLEPFLPLTPSSVLTRLDNCKHMIEKNS